jgi:hypothetical protein
LVTLIFIEAGVGSHSCSFTLDGQRHLGIAASRIILRVKLQWRVDSTVRIILSMYFNGVYALVLFLTRCAVRTVHLLPVSCRFLDGHYWPGRRRRKLFVREDVLKSDLTAHNSDQK